MAQIILGDLLERLSHAKLRMSNRKGDTLAVGQAIDVLTQMAMRLAELEAKAVADEVAQSQAPRITLVS